MSMISKQVADLREYADERKGELANLINRAADTIEALLTERTGEWTQNENGTYTCSECQTWLPEEQYHYANYCLHCGARMKG